MTTLEPDDAVPDVVRTEAERSGMSPDQVDAAVRQDPDPTVLDTLSERNRLDEAEAMTTARGEITAHREARRNLPLSGDEFVARVRAAAPSAADDVSITRDGRRLDSRRAIREWLAEVEADRAAGRYVEYDEPMTDDLGETRSGKPITEDLLDQLTTQAEDGLDVEEILRRRGGRPPMGSSAAAVESVRLDPELSQAPHDRAQLEGRTNSDLLREALRA